MSGKKKSLENESPKTQMEEEIGKKEIENENEKDINGVTEGALHALGKMLPGLGDLVKGLEKSEAFQERLKSANAEVERQITKGTPLRTVQGSRPSIIPPKTTLKVSRSILGDDKEQESSFDGHTSFGSRSSQSQKKAQSTQRSASAQNPPNFPNCQNAQREVITDIFDEGDHLKVIAELPGIEEKDIAIDIRDKNLKISANVAGKKYYKELELPCTVKKEYQSSCKNGILQIVMEKA
jgi:HSP20 family molecular chaperone IbpA